MNPRSFIIITSILMLLGRIADVLVTYHFSPTLSMEGNPLTLFLGAGWEILLAVNLLAVAAIAWCSYSWCAKPIEYATSPEVRDIWTFASFACYDRVYSRRDFIWRRLLCPPKHKAHNMHLVGAVMPVTVAIVSVLAVLSWHALYGLHLEGYSHFYKLLFPFFPYALMIPTIWIAAAYFYRHEYQRYLAHCESAKGSVNVIGAVA